MRLGCVEIFIEIVNINPDCWDLSRLSRIFKNFWDFLTIIEIFWILDIWGRWWGKVLPWLGLPPPPSTDFYNLSKNLVGDICTNPLFLDQDWEIIEQSKKIWKVLISLDKSQSRLRSTDLYIPVETKSRNLYLDWDILIKTCFSPVSRSRVSIETQSRLIETPRLSYLTLS